MQKTNELAEVICTSTRTLFILCGFPYAGKSYVAKQLLEQSNIVLVSIDDIFHERGFDWSSSTLPNLEQWDEIFKQSYDKTSTLLESRNNVLFDSTNQTKESRDTLREVAKSVDADTCVIYVKTPVKTVWERWEKNQTNPSRSIVGRELVQATIDIFEEPTAEENVIIIDN